MYNLVKSEWYKLRKNPSFRILTMIIVAMSIFWPFFWYFDNLLDGDPPMTGIESFLGALEGNAYIMRVSLCILAGFFISNDFSTGVMKSMASSGHSRKTIFTAKLTVYACGMMIVSLLFPVFNVVLSTLLSGFGELDQGAVIEFVFRSLALTLLYSAAFASIAALFAVILTDSGKTITVTLIFFLVVDSLSAIIGSYHSVIGTVYGYTVFKLLGDIGRIAPGKSELWRLIIVPILTFVGCGLLGNRVFSRKEIK
ncbi:ABC transporter permease [Paenibacillus ehimensis]|uniref:ABC transporter permease n=1 Tax=Paenibacillus ehimensis TaxID=79264 RepID=UPI002DBEF706|nr:ABC transporter permease [Paenibacillus ehimensis]MEC0211782.1 ABC transporter permease [Paenibacillus ehimensis]